METVSAQATRTEKSNGWRAILSGGLIAGALDLTAAFVTNYWINPVRIMQSIASGLLGANSYAGGAATAALGVFLHFVIAFGATVVFIWQAENLIFSCDTQFCRVCFTARRFIGLWN